ncbi:MAG TPA: lysophospholipid acyltransferase family protein [Burkholderiales bacterium]|nr:lysophospholipid acyltransferase family protein [Burkholderiales bacterium]
MTALLRSSVFALFQAIITPVFALLALFVIPFPAAARYRFITTWSRLMLAGAETILGIRYRVLGAENLPPPPYIVLAKHQSAWETLAFQVIFPQQVWVVKRELLWIPFFGWGLAMLAPIAIDRASGPRALNQLLEQGRERLARRYCIVIFPEGTRIAPGSRGKYQVGGAWLAVKTGTPVVPVAHNAGELWRRRAFIKRPGLVTVSIGAAIDPRGLTPEELIRRVESWIEGEMQKRKKGPGSIF